MAILAGFPGLEVDILVNGVARKEYPDPESSNEDSPSSVTTYIEAEDGANFVVQLRRDHTFEYRANELCWSVSLDGKMVRETLVKSDTDAFYGNATIEGDAPLKTLDKKLLQKMLQLGQITVAVHRVTTGQHVQSAERRTEVSLDTSDISEKALKGKAISRKAKLGPPVSIVAPQLVHTKWVDPKDKPFASFAFRYRSTNDLKAEFIIPRSRSPVPLEDRPVEDLSPEEMRELLKRQKKQLEDAALIKREARKFKREPDADSVIDLDDDDVSAKRRRVETVDLTSD